MRLNKRTIAISTISLVIVGGASAFAYVSATGSGTGSASTITSTSPVTLTAGPAAGLVPGTAAPVVLTGTNPNAFTVELKNPLVTIASVTPATCDASEFAIVDGSSATITSANGVTQGTSATITWGGDTGSTATDGCLGATVNLTVATS